MVANEHFIDNFEINRALLLKPFISTRDFIFTDNFIFTDDTYSQMTLVIYKCKVKNDAQIYIHKQRERLSAALPLDSCVFICVFVQLSGHV